MPEALPLPRKPRLELRAVVQATVERSTIRDGFGEGITAVGESTLVVEEGSINKNARGIRVYNASTATVRESTVSENHTAGASS